MKRWSALILIVVLAVSIGNCNSGGQGSATPTATAPPLYQGPLAFNSNRDGHYEIWLVNSDGTGLRQLTDGGLGERNAPAWSPDGTHIAYYVQTRAMYTAVPEDIMILSVDDPRGEHTRITFTPPIVDRDPAWSPAPPDGGTSGQTILYSADFVLMACAPMARTTACCVTTTSTTCRPGRQMATASPWGCNSATTTGASMC